MTDVAPPRTGLARLAPSPFWIGVLLWTVATLALWPLALSFGDEVGYIGQARLIADGRLAAGANDVGIWFPTAEGLRPKYPLFLPALLAPLFAVSPALIFLPGVVAAIALAWAGSRVLAAWGRSPAWGLLLLADPTVVMMSRTAMADLLLACFAVATWHFMRRRSFWPTVVFAAGTMAVKTNGVVLIGSLLAGEAMSLLLRGPPTRASLKPLLGPLAGLVLGGAAVVALNFVANGTVHSSYRESAGEAFGLRFLQTTGVVHLKSLLICPPLLIAGAWTFWRRRELAPLCAVATSAIMMCVFFYADWGLGRLDSLVLSRRLILPVVAFLLIGYADLLAGLLRRPRLERAVRLLLVVAPVAVALALGVKHRGWQARQGQALERAAAWADRAGGGELGLTASARKIGLLYPGRTSQVVPGRNEPAVVLCGTTDASYRLGNAANSCAIPHYVAVETLKDQGYDILLRADKTP